MYKQAALFTRNYLESKSDRFSRAFPPLFLGGTLALNLAMLPYLEAAGRPDPSDSTEKIMSDILDQYKS